jgi:hypothetical protein
MNARTQKIISSSIVAIAVTGGFQSLIFILNLNQGGIFIRTAALIWLYLCLKVFLLYDLHFKKTSQIGQALENRLKHLWHWDYLRHWLNYLFLPTLIFWSTVAVLYVNFGRWQIQETYAWLSSAALVINFWYLKEAFDRKKEIVDQDIFVALSVVKIYTAAAAFGGAMALMRSFCLSPWLFALAMFGITFSLIYQALFQHNLIKVKTLLATAMISFFQAVFGYAVYVYWGYNYFSGAVFLAAFYNFFWGAYHYHLDRTLTKKAFFEILLICAAVAALIFINTNFKARLIGGCVF